MKKNINSKKMKQTQKKKVYENFSSWRFVTVSVIAGILAISLISRLAFIQLVEPDYLMKQSDMRSLRVTKSVAERGNIEDRFGEKLAVSVPAYAIWIDPKEIKKHFAMTPAEMNESLLNYQETGKKRDLKRDFYQSKKWPALAEVLGIEMATLIKMINRPRARFAYLKRQVNPSVVSYIKQLKLKGVGKQLESHRFYPTGEINANLLGLTDLDSEGIEGIEMTYNSYLKGENGIKRVRKDRLGNVIDDIAVIKEKKEAGILQLSLDQRIQAVAYTQLKRAVKINEATSGSVVVIDVHTGEIYAMANYPSFNSNDRTQYRAFRARNRAITDTFEPGSVVKPLVVASALSYHKADFDEVIDTSPGWMNLGGRRVRDHANLGKLDLATILKKSSNMGITKLALRLKPEQLERTFASFGFGNDTGVSLIGESVGRLPTRHRWSKFELATMSFGYGITTTTLQLAKAYAILGSGGMSYPTTIIKNKEEPLGERVISERIAREVVHMMEGVSERGGTAPKAKVDGYRMAGKTGTSRKAIAGGYGDDYVAVFAGVAPASDPRFAIAVMINEPQGDVYYAGDVAAPVFSAVMKSSLLLTHIRPDKPNENYTFIE